MPEKRRFSGRERALLRTLQEIDNMKRVNPRHGSMQFWPRRRAKSSLARVRSWPTGKDVTLAGFLGYKVGMAHITATEPAAKNAPITIPCTILECPPLGILSARFYLNKQIQTEVLAQNLDEALARTIALPKKNEKTLDNVEKEYDEIRLLMYSQPKLTTIGKKKPDVLEVALGGKEQLDWVKENFDKQIAVSDVFKAGDLVDAHAITTGKGYQGVIKRFGVTLKAKKSEKGQRRVGSRSGGWYAQAHMMYRVAQPGKMGFHTRTEYNKKILIMGDGLENKAGFKRYGEVKNTYVAIKGSLGGSVKRAVKLTVASRPSKKLNNQQFNNMKVIL